MDMSAIELENIHFSYNGDPVLKGISFAIKKGEYAGIIGPNGGGKTTLLRVILGLSKPDAGSVRLFGEPIASFRDWAKIGYLPQRAAHVDVRFPITVHEVVSQGRVAKAGLFKRLSSDDFAAIDKALLLSDISHLKKRLISDLSGGERQRVFIARALASSPEVLILDEPASGVDVISQGRFYRFLKDLNEEHGITIVFVSHDIDIIANEASRIICINRSLVCEGPTSLIFNKKRDVLESMYGDSIKFMFKTEK